MSNTPNVTVGDYIDAVCRLAISPKRAVIKAAVRSLPDLDRREILAELNVWQRPEITREELTHARIAPAFWRRQPTWLDNLVSLAIGSVAVTLATGAFLALVALFGALINRIVH